MEGPGQPCCPASKRSGRASKMCSSWKVNTHLYSRLIKTFQALDSNLPVAFGPCACRRCCSALGGMRCFVCPEVIVNSYLNSPNYV